ncbi:MAG: putative O-glycosylation ligase, exosortase A system-associated [Candidatus Rokuibacteriota bacterium]|nr:MAG: putative O-glycosylation ligase, exosortase A system-associated [Candidatus Rokubacteria bacterium]
MPARDIILVTLIAGLLPLCFFRTWIGLLVWTWMAFMNPHRLTWDFAYSLPFSEWVAMATLGGLVFSSDRKPVVWTRETILFLALWAWFCITTLTAMYPEAAWGQLERVSKIFLMSFLLIPFFQDRRRIRVLLLVVAGSIGYYGLKGGIWALLTGGENLVLGAPGNTFISTNNALALALNMCLPIFFYLAKEEPRRWLRYLLHATFFASIVSVLFTYSRGGFLGLLVVLGVLFLSRQNVLPVVLAALLLCLLAFGFAPQKWVNRIDTIVNYQQDGSAMGRLTAWSVAFQLATDNPITGGGFWSIINGQTYRRYLPDYALEDSPDAHSIYFGLLGEHGFPGDTRPRTRRTRLGLELRSDAPGKHHRLPGHRNVCQLRVLRPRLPGVHRLRPSEGARRPAAHPSAPGGRHQHGTARALCREGKEATAAATGLGQVKRPCAG